MGFAVCFKRIFNHFGDQNPEKFSACGGPDKNTPPLIRNRGVIRGGILIWGGILKWNSPDIYILYEGTSL